MTHERKGPREAVRQALVAYRNGNARDAMLGLKLAHDFLGGCPFLYACAELCRLEHQNASIVWCGWMPFRPRPRSEEPGISLLRQWSDFLRADPELYDHITIQWMIDHRWKV